MLTWLYLLLSAGSAFLLRTRWVALFSLKALRSPVALQKLFRRFFATQPVGSADFVLENSAQNFCSCCRRRSPTASAAALKLKIALKSWSLVFYSRYRETQRTAKF
ncbi:hypothetical protein [Campylobacter sp.]|uniref:hypothetical protein n=1 Tax=Campylobacter sp. TaxID=205 RepID=UPI002A5C06B2|nr:hypothetical protein [Campylobacter sp.]MDD7703252.1 hypothetical protein [Campylobacteraceae bacterium]MDY2636067.1 hypothetical protein [Campylobacter sp.]